MFDVEARYKRLVQLAKLWGADKVQENPAREFLQIAREGIPTMVISIPLRYMHTPVEIISMKDIKRAGRLLAEFITGVEADFMDNLSLYE